MPDFVQAITVCDRVSASRLSTAANRQIRPSSSVCRPAWHLLRCRPPSGRRLANLVGVGAALGMSIILTGCGAPAPKDYGGAWTRVNQFQSAPTEIPLAPAYAFFASPMDATLMTMLRRWTRDNGMQLSYQAGSDFTLYQPVAKLRTGDLQAAVSELNAVYSSQGLLITADNKRILVRNADVASLPSGSN